MRLLIIMLSTICSLSISSVGYADECDSALIISVHKNYAEKKSDWRLATLVSQSNYDELKTDAGVNGEIYGIPVGASFSDYKNSAENELKIHKESLSKEEKQNILWTGLGANGLKAYEICKTQGKYGLFLYPRKATQSQLELLLNFQPTNAGDKPLKLIWSGGDVGLLAQLPKSINANQKSSIVVKRPLGQKKLLLSVNGGILSAPAISITSYPPRRPTGYLVHHKDTFTGTGNRVSLKKFNSTVVIYDKPGGCDGRPDVGKCITDNNGMLRSSVLDSCTRNRVATLGNRVNNEGAISSASSYGITVSCTLVRIEFN